MDCVVQRGQRRGGARELALRAARSKRRRLLMRVRPRLRQPDDKDGHEPTAARSDQGPRIAVRVAYRGLPPAAALIGRHSRAARYEGASRSDTRSTSSP